MNFAVKVGSTKERTIRISSAQTTSFLWEGENVPFNTFDDIRDGRNL